MSKKKLVIPEGFDAAHPGDEIFGQMVEEINAVHERLGGWMSDRCKTPEDMIRMTVNILVWVGTSFGYLKATDCLDINNTFFEGMEQNLRVGIDIGYERAMAVRERMEGTVQ